METKNLIIICATLVVAVIIVLSAFIFTNMTEETHLSSNIADTMQSGDSFTITLLNKNNNPLANKPINLNIENNDGITLDKDFMTDENGEISYVLNFSSGNFTITAEYPGDMSLGPSTLSKSVEIKKETVTTSPTNSSKTATTKNKTYTDWQKDYETGEYDEDGNPIIRSVFSTSGGQYEPGIYEAYWSANGPISERRIG